jgi:hypothetical protein
MTQGLLRWWHLLDEWVERAVLHRLSSTERLLLHAGLVATVVFGFAGSYFWPNSADQFLFLQLAMVTFFFGLRVGAVWVFPTWATYALNAHTPTEGAVFAAFCVYGLLIAGVTVRKFRASRYHELQMSSALEIARQVQISLLPPPLVQWDQAEMASSVEAARELGGDLVCWQLRPGGAGVFVLVGDVMGKGAQAALTAAYVKGLFDELAQSATDPDDLLMQLHQHLVRRTVVDSFLAAMCIELNYTERCWKVCRAGLPSAFIVRRDGTHVNTPDAGIMLGVPLEPDLQVTTMSHQPGDQLFLASDGLLEEEDAPPELLEALSGGSDTSLKTLHRCVQTLLRRGTDATHADDRTAVLIHWK